MFYTVLYNVSKMKNIIDCRDSTEKVSQQIPIYTLYGFHNFTTSVIECVFRVIKGNNNMTECKKIKKKYILIRDVMRLKKYV